ncbi:MAG: two-component system sensor histidine kinase NtrB [Elusimicrobiota bacterium]
MTSKEELKEQLKIYKTRLEDAMEAGRLAWWEMDLPSGKVRFNDRKAKMLGYSPDRFEHYSDFTDLIHPEEHDRAMKAMRNHLEGKKERYEVEYRIKKKSGEYKWFRDVGAVTETAENSKIVTGVVIDIDDRKRMRQRQKKLQREIMEKERIYHIGQMAAGVAHEINNPLTNILTTAQLLLEEQLGKEVREDLKVIKENSDRISSTIKGFLGFTKDRDFQLNRLNINDLLENSLDLVDKYNKNKIKIRKQYSDKISKIKTSRFHLEEVFTNLIKNAIESMKNSSEKVLTLKTEEKEDYLKIVIEDTGEGIEKENIEKIFEPYYTTKGKKGTGLGLPTCKDILQKLRGDITVKSDGKGKGAKFKITIEKNKNK